MLANECGVRVHQTVPANSLYAQVEQARPRYAARRVVLRTNTSANGLHTAAGEAGDLAKCHAARATGA